MLQQMMGWIVGAVKRLAGVWQRKHESAKQESCSLAHVFQIIRLVLHVVSGSSKRQLANVAMQGPTLSHAFVTPRFRVFNFALPRALVVLGLMFATPSWAVVDPAAVTILKDQTTDFLITSVADSLGARAVKISQAYSNDFMRVFGQANAIKNEQQRIRMQSWASKQSRYYATLAFKQRTKVTMATKLALTYGAAPLLEEAWAAQELESNINDLKSKELQFNSLIPASAWDSYMTNVALGTIDAGLTASAQASASYVLSKMLSISLKAAGYPVTIVWGIFGDPFTAGPAVENFMPNPSDTVALVAWATQMSENAALLESGCAGNSGCLENAGQMPGFWSFFKLKYEYFNALGSPSAARYSWVTRYGICSNSAMGVCAATLGTSVIGDSYSPFRDVAPDNWASCYITKLWRKGIVNGQNGLFEPTNKVSRAEFLKMTMNAAFSPSQFTSTAPVTYFKDSDFTAWQHPYVNSALQRNIVHGSLCPGSSTDHCFYPNAPITRSEAVTILVQSFGLQQKGAAINFSDAQASQYPLVSAAASNQGNSDCGGDDEPIISGFKDGNFYPNAQITRDQAAKIVAVALSLKKP